MKTLCLGCKYADWRRNADGKLHKSGEGRCTAPFSLKLDIPAAFYELQQTRIGGGFVHRSAKPVLSCNFFTSKEN